MLRFWFKFTIPLTFAVAAAIIFLMYIQPYDDSELRAFLFPPDGCPAPCFMGIRPGVTTMEDAVRILEHHKWVDSINDKKANSTEAIVQWTWSGLQPPFINNQYGAYLSGPIGGTVTSMRIPLSLPMIEIWWLFGQPLLQIANTPYARGKWYIFAYPEHGMMITSIEQRNCIPLLKTLLNTINFVELRSIENMREASTDFQGFTAIPFSAFSNRKSCHQF